MRILLAASFLFLSACGQFEPAQQRISGVNEEFIPYVGLYTYYKRSALSYSIPMGFADLPDNIVGQCTRWDDGHRQILIDKQYWDNADESLRISLIAHELGHCDLNRGHSHDMNSIMYEINLGAYDWYELFHPAGIDHKATHDHETISE